MIQTLLIKKNVIKDKDVYVDFWYVCFSFTKRINPVRKMGGSKDIFTLENVLSSQSKEVIGDGDEEKLN